MAKKNGCSSDFFDKIIDIAMFDTRHSAVCEHRKRALSLVAEVYGIDRTAVLLWRADDSGYGPQLRLARFYDHKETEVKPDLLRQKTISLDNFSNQDAARSSLCSSPDSNSVRTWFQKNHPHGEMEQILYPLIHQEPNSSQNILGWLHILSFRLRNKAQRSTISQRMKWLVSIITHAIANGERTRPMDAIKALNDRLSNISDVDKILQVAVDVLREHTSAQLAISLKLGDGDHSKLKATNISYDQSLKSLITTQMFHTGQGYTSSIVFNQKETIRIDDIHESGINHKLAFSFNQSKGLEVLDSILDPVSSYIGTPVVVDSEVGSPKSIFCLVAYNKKSNDYIHDTFSKADAQIATSIGTYLSKVLPGSITLASMNAISKQLVDESISNTKTVAELPYLIYSLLCKYVNGIEGVGILLENTGEIIPHVQAPEWNDYINNSSRELGFHPIGDTDKTIYVCYLGGAGSGRLLVGLRRKDVPLYQVTIIERTAADVGHLCYEMVNYQQAITHLLEVRHAIGSAIQGVLGHIGSISKLYKLLESSGNANLIKREMFDNKGFKLSIENAKLAAEQCSTLMTVARIEFSNIKFDTLRLDDHDISLIIKNVISTTKPEANHRNISINFENRCNNKDIKYRFDKNGITIVIFNLIDNALKYAFRDTNVDISLSDNHDSWNICVRNEGLPIRKNNYEEIFKPYRRLVIQDHAARNKISSRPGTGLGLYVCRKIIRAHGPGADITVVSVGEPDRAQVIFIVTIPIHIMKYNLSSKEA